MKISVVGAFGVTFEPSHSAGALARTKSSGLALQPYKLQSAYKRDRSNSLVTSPSKEDVMAWVELRDVFIGCRVQSLRLTGIEMV